jgi:hypothetical protein
LNTSGSSESAGIKVLIFEKDEEAFVKNLGITVPPGAHALVGIELMEVSTTLGWFQGRIILFSLRNTTFVFPMTYWDKVLEAQIIIPHRFFTVHPIFAMTSTFVFMKFEFQLKNKFLRFFTSATSYSTRNIIL